jgi:predicted DNA-binding protein
MPRGRPTATANSRVVSIRIAPETAARAETLAAAAPQLTSLTRVLARAIELGIAEVERELAGAVSKGPGNGAGVRADVGTPGASL